MFRIIGKYSIEAKKEVLGINIKTATRSWAKPKKFQYNPVLYNASKKNPSVLSTPTCVNRSPNNFVRPEGMNAMESNILVNQVKSLKNFKEEILE